MLDCGSQDCKTDWSPENILYVYNKRGFGYSPENKTISEFDVHMRTTLICLQFWILCRPHKALQKWQETSSSQTET